MVPFRVDGHVLLLYYPVEYSSIPHSLHVAFLQYGPGGLSKSDTNAAIVSPCSALHTKKCNCGVRNKGDSDGDHCVPLTQKYSTFVRCPPVFWVLRSL